MHADKALSKDLLTFCTISEMQLMNLNCDAITGLKFICNVLNNFVF